MKKTAVIAVLLLVLVASMLALNLAYRDGNRQAPVVPAKPLAPIEGALSIVSLDILRVGGKPIALCGVTARRAPALQALFLETAKRLFQNQVVTCLPVGMGTPCDGRTPASFGAATVAQCKTKAGIDVAEQLAREGIFCDLPAQSGGIYRSCQGQ